MATKQAPARRKPPAPQAPKRRGEPTRGSRRTLALVAGGALLVAAVLIGVSVLGARGGDEPATVATVDPSYLSGIEQDGRFLGSPDAPFTLIEYADVQCSFCGDYAEDVLPGLVERYVREGTLRLEYRGLAFLGEDSRTGLEAALAAGEQDRLWHVLDGLYAQQRDANSGWLTDELVREIAAATPGLDVERFQRDRGAGGFDNEIARLSDQARIDGVPGTPHFLIAPRTGGTPTPLQVTSLTLDAFTQALDAVIEQ